MKTPYFDENTTLFTGSMDGTIVLGTHTPGKETFAIPASVLLKLMDLYIEVYTPKDEEGEQYQ